MWEEPPISGINGSGTVFFSHCPLKCVYCQNREISSGGDGLTDKIALPAPPRANSETPNGGVPFYTYNIEIVRDGYFNQTYQNVPVFEGITAMQTAEMIPLPKNGKPDRASVDNGIFFEGENPNIL